MSPSLSGSEAIKGALAVVGGRKAKYSWPYPWEVPPAGSKHVFVPGSIVSPVTSAVTQIISYQVPNTFNFCLHALVLTFAAGGVLDAYAPWVPGSGSVTFGLTVNTSAGLTAAQGTPFPNLGSILVPLGSLIQGPWPINPGENSILKSRDVLRATVAIDPLVIPSGSPNYFHAAFVGWIWPE